MLFLKMQKRSAKRLWIDLGENEVAVVAALEADNLGLMEDELGNTGPLLEKLRGALSLERGTGAAWEIKVADGRATIARLEELIEDLAAAATYGRMARVYVYVDQFLTDLAAAAPQAINPAGGVTRSGGGQSKP